MNISEEHAKRSNDELNCPEESSTNPIDKILKGEKYLNEKKVDLKYFEDDIFSKKKKRAFTLGAIDGIGDISLPKAPPMCPVNPDTEPPILQLPCVTNLIKNIHVKASVDADIDKSYKYRTQNSNRDILTNMKPLYSLPENVMTYYMQSNEMKTAKNEKEKGINEQNIKTKKENEGDLNNNEMNIFQKEQVETYRKCEFEESKQTVMLKNSITLEEQNYCAESPTETTTSIRIDKPAVLENQATSVRATLIENNKSREMQSKIKDRKNEREKEKDPTEQETIVKHNRGNHKTLLKNVNNTSNNISDVTNFEDANEIMSPSLIKALKFLAGDTS